MEAAAMEAYKKDMEREGVDLTSGNPQCSKITKLWKEEKTRDGSTSYVNIMTKERVWQPPREGYMSIKEQREQSDVEAYKQFKEMEKFKQREAMATMQQQQAEEAEASARLAREKMKERRVVDDTPPVTYAPLIEPGKIEPYGKWQTVQETVLPDLQLPVQEWSYDVPEYPVEYEPEVPVKEFKEKTVESLGGGSGEVSFKKRKLNNAAKRNARQRLDDE